MMLKIMASFVVLDFRDILLVNLHSQSELHFLLQYATLLQPCHESLRYAVFGHKIDLIYILLPAT